MDCLPAEVLIQVFAKLPLQRKLECMLVCYRWWQIIRSNGLLDTICQMNSLEKLFNMLKEHPTQGNQVKRLMLLDCFSHDFDRSKIFQLFPSLRFIYVKQLLKVKNQNFLRKPLQPITLTRNLIERIIDLDASDVSCYVLASGQCPCLTILEVDFMFTNRSCHHFIPLLKNAPNILKLKMINTNMTINDLESVHNDLPFIHSLNLSDVHIIITDIISDIVPATSVKTLLLYLKYMKVESQIQLLLYISNKYPFLTHFRFWNPTHEIWEQQDRTSFSRNGLAPLLNYIGPQLKSLELSSISLESGFFENLDRYGCHLQYLCAVTYDKRNILPPLIQSNQCIYLKKLTLQNILPFSFELLKNMTSLVSLELIYNYQGDNQYRNNYSVINFTSLLEMCPDTVKSIVIRYATLECNSTTSRSFLITNLVIEGPRLPTNISTFLSDHFPNLQSLTLLDCIRMGTSLKLSNLKLTYLKLLPERMDHLTTLSITTLTDNTCRFYIVKKKYFYVDSIDINTVHCDPFIYDAIKSVPPYELGGSSPMVTVECKSVETLVINGRLVC